MYNLDARATIKPRNIPREGGGPPLHRMCGWGQQCEMVYSAGDLGGFAWCLAHLLAGEWRGNRIVIVGDYASHEPYLTAADKEYFTTVCRDETVEYGGPRTYVPSPDLPPRNTKCYNSYHAAANARDASQTLLPSAEVVAAAQASYDGVAEADLPADPLEGKKVMIVCSSKKEYVNPRRFGEDGTWAEFISTPLGGLAALVYNLCYSNAGGGGDLECTIGMWPGETVGIYAKGTIDLEEYEDVSLQWVRSLREAVPKNEYDMLMKHWDAAVTRVSGRKRARDATAGSGSPYLRCMRLYEGAPVVLQVLYSFTHVGQVHTLWH
jgi:hypothetical protein